jgi:deoxycytidylate deaminase
MAEVAARISGAVSATSNEDGQIRLKDRHTPELVFGFCGLMGSGVSKSVEILKDLLVKQYHYEDIQIVRVSDLIAECAKLVGENYNQDTKGAVRVEILQRIGTKLRGRFSASYLAKKCIERIASHRESSGGYHQDYRDLPLARRSAFIIDSLKHPEEIELLRTVYNDAFWLIAVFAPEDIREKRLKSIGVDAAKIPALIRRDRDDAPNWGQHVDETVRLADFFVRNDHQAEKPLRGTLARYLSLLFNTSVHTQTPDESAMSAATAAAARSACLSRQVGAAILSESNELLGVGWNDVPMFGGGLYHSHADDDHRCYRWGQKICHNDDRKASLYEKISTLLFEGGMISSGVSREAVKSILASTEIKRLIEYSRAVHAEMEAIISVARSQKGSLINSRMFVTTFPCHSCARHIVAAGVKEVVFIEPYSKSLATELHDDSVSSEDPRSSGKVIFRQYEGVAPRNAVRLFNHGKARKKDGKAIEIDPNLAEPVFLTALDGYAKMEQIVVKELLDEESKERPGE